MQWPMYPPKPIRGWFGTPLYDRLVADRSWLVQPKLNGDRCLAVFRASGPELWSRHGRRFTYGWLEPLLAELRGLRVPIGTVLDGELLAERGRSDYGVFDIGSETTSLGRRLVVLDRLLRRGRCARFVGPIVDKAGAYAAAVDEGHEGVVFKRVDSVYAWQRGPSGTEVPTWVKVTT